MKTIVKCQHCNYIWTTTSTLKFVTCPSCKNKTSNKPAKLIPLIRQAEAIIKALDNTQTKETGITALKTLKTPRG